MRVQHFTSSGKMSADIISQKLSWTFSIHMESQALISEKKFKKQILLVVLQNSHVAREVLC